MKLYLEVITPTGALFEGEVLNASFPGAMGAFMVLPRHAPLISVLDKGEISYSTDGVKKEHLPIDGGFVEVRNNRVTAAVEKVKEDKSDRDGRDGRDGKSDKESKKRSG